MSYERPHIQRMHGYVPGEQPEAADVAKLNTNENPYPPSAAVQDALKKFDPARLRRYPSPLADGFRRAAAALHGVSIDNIIPTNGGDELLRLVLTTFVDHGESIVITEPSYSLYPVLADIQDAKLQRIALDAQWQLPTDMCEQLANSDAKLAILVNPHAPSGTLIDSPTISQLADAFRGVLLVDEAYVDFVDPKLGYDSVPLIAEHPNLLLLRTLSKGYSLAGLRFGYGIGPASLLAPMLYKTRDSYNTDGLSQALAQAAIESVEEARETWSRVRISRTDLAAALENMGFHCLPSQTNFILATVPEGSKAHELYSALKQRGVILRYFDQPRLTDKLRISIGTEEENARLLRELKTLLDGTGS